MIIKNDKNLAKQRAKQAAASSILDTIAGNTAKVNRMDNRSGKAYELTMTGKTKDNKFFRDNVVFL